MKKREIELYSCMTENEYEIVVLIDLSKTTPYEFLIASEQFYPKALKSVELQVSSIIHDILSEYGITYVEDNRDSYESALKELKSKGKRITIEKIKSFYEEDTKQYHKVVKTFDDAIFLLSSDDTLYTRIYVRVEDYV